MGDEVKGDIVTLKGGKRATRLVSADGSITVIPHNGSELFHKPADGAYCVVDGSFTKPH